MPLPRPPGCVLNVTVLEDPAISVDNWSCRYVGLDRGDRTIGRYADSQCRGALGDIFASRSIASILYVRQRLRLEKGKRHSRMMPAVAHIAALFLTAMLAYYGLSPSLTILAMSVLAYRALLGLSPGRKKMKAMQIGVWEIIYGTMVVLSVVIGHHAGF